MQFRFNVSSSQWEACFPQSGSNSGWSDWEMIDRQQALNFIEKGFTFDRHYG